MKSAPGPLLKYPLRLRNLSLLKTSYFEKKIAGTPFKVVAERGKFRLLHFSLPNSKRENQKAPLLLIPSLINRYSILDLYSGCSIVESLLMGGNDIFLLDWGEARPQDKFLTLEDHQELGITWARNKTLELSRKTNLHLLGQCLGGTLAAKSVANDPDGIQSFIALTTPIDFHVEGVFYHWATKSRLNLDQMVEAWGNIHAEFLDRSFQLISPLSHLRQKRALWELGWSELFLKKHVAITKWVSNGTSFPGLAYKELIENFYLKNQVELTEIKKPTLALIAKGDEIVPPESSRALANYCDQYNEANIPGGHIGCVVGETGFKVLEKNLKEWLEFAC